MSYVIVLKNMFRLYQLNTVTPNRKLAQKWSDAKNLWAKVSAESHQKAGVDYVDGLLSEETCKKMHEAMCKFELMTYFHEVTPIIEVTVDVYELHTSYKKWLGAMKFEPGMFKPGWIIGYTVRAKFAGAEMAINIEYGGETPEMFLDDQVFIDWAKKEIKLREKRMRAEIKQWNKSAVRVAEENGLAELIPMEVWNSCKPKTRETKHHLTSLTPAKQKRLEAGKPLFGHDCRHCKFLGSYQSPENGWWYDLYYCGKGGFNAIEETFIARYGYDGNYSSGLFLGIPQLVEAMKRAVQNGLITNFDLSKSGLWPDQKKELENIIQEWLKESN